MSIITSNQIKIEYDIFTKCAKISISLSINNVNTITSTKIKFIKKLGNNLITQSNE